MTGTRCRRSSRAAPAATSKPDAVSRTRSATSTTSPFWSPSPTPWMCRSPPGATPNTTAARCRGCAGRRPFSAASGRGRPFAGASGGAGPAVLLVGQLLDGEVLGLEPGPRLHGGGVEGAGRLVFVLGGAGGVVFRSGEVDHDVLRRRQRQEIHLVVLEDVVLDG